jgi:hypothetical protein
MHPRWVRQEDAYGCKVATLAMITGLPYQQVKAEVGFDGSLGSSCEARQIKWLEARGFTVESIYFKPSGFDRRADRIPQDRPYLLWVSVGTNHWRHSVLQMPTGEVLDPEHPEPRRLADYPEVQQVRVVAPKETVNS